MRAAAAAGDGTWEAACDRAAFETECVTVTAATVDEGGCVGVAGCRFLKIVPGVLANRTGEERERASTGENSSCAGTVAG